MRGAKAQDHVQDDRLQKYFDGELDGEPARALRQELDADADLRAKLEGLAHLRTLMVAAAEARAEEIDSGALFGAIEAKLAEDAAEDDDPMLPAQEVLDEEPAPPAARPRLGVVPGGKKSEKSDANAAATRNRNVVWIGTATVLAIAAAVLLVIVQPFGGPGEGPVAGAPPPGSEVVEVDFGYSTGAVFSVEGQQGEHYAVVWISDEKVDLLGDETDERIQ